MANDAVNRDLLPEIRNSIDKLKNRSTDILQKLVRTPSVTGDEHEVQRLIAQLFSEIHLGVDLWCPTKNDLQRSAVYSDDGLPLGNRPVVVGVWEGSDRSARTLILNGHSDVVPPGNELQWNGGPWSGKIQDGRLYGRGACDMKGGIVSGILAIEALQHCGWRPQGSVIFESVIGEETGGAGTLATVMRGYRAVGAIVLEPTRLQICPVGAGAASFRLTVPGLAAHGAMRKEGVSALEKFVPILNAISELETERHLTFHHPLFSRDSLTAPISIGKIHAGDWPSTVPESLIAEGRYGIFPGEPIQSARMQFESRVRECSHQDEWLRDHPPQVEWFEGQFESSNTPLESELIQQLVKAHAHSAGAEPEIKGVPYGSDLRFFTNQAGMHAVLYGPGDVAVAHSANEFVPLNEVFSCALTLAFFITDWCG